MKFGLGKHWLAVFLLVSCLAASETVAQDFSDPADILRYRQKQKAGDAGLPEIAGAIETATTAKPGWYALGLKLDNGKEIKVVVVPATKFYKDYAPIDSAAAYPQLVQGCKIRALHDPEQDLLLRNIIVKDLMFESPPVEYAGAIKTSASSKPGVYDLTVNLKGGGERHLNLDPKTKYWKDNKPIDPTTAYPQIAAGQKIRALEKPAPNNQRCISDVMFVDKYP
jgi:hypothetical protein